MQRTQSKLQLPPCSSSFPSCNSNTAWANHSLKVSYSHSLGSYNFSSAVLLHCTGFCLIALFNTTISLFNLETVTKDIASSVSTTDWITMLWPTFCLVYCTTLPPLQPFLLTSWSFHVYSFLRIATPRPLSEIFFVDSISGLTFTTRICLPFPANIFKSCSFYLTMFCL